MLDRTRNKRESRRKKEESRGKIKQGRTEVSGGGGGSTLGISCCKGIALRLREGRVGYLPPLFADLFSQGGSNTIQWKPECPLPATQRAAGSALSLNHHRCPVSSTLQAWLSQQHVPTYTLV